ncbi:hypothetical protein TrRE_jg2882, partial [Triparma retinervis]
LFNNKS